MLTYFLFLTGAKVLFLNQQMHSSEILFHPIHMERLKVQFHGPYAGHALSHRMPEYYLQGQNAAVQQTHSNFSHFFLLLIILLLNIGLKYKLKNTLERMYNWRLCMYIQYVKKPLFLYFKCSKLIKSNNYHAIFHFLFSKCFSGTASW